jgi:hypothetical protein
MQKADRKLAWSAVLVLAVIAFEFAWFLFVGPVEHGSVQGASNTPQGHLPWWDSAAFWTACFTFFLTISTGLLWWQTKRLAKGAEEQARITKDDFVASHRPWIAVEVKPGENGLHYDDGGTLFVHLDTICHNVGNSPAKDVAVHIRQYLLRDAKDMNDPNGREEILAAMNEFRTQIDDPPYVDNDRIPVIFPGKTFSDYGDRAFYTDWVLRQFSGGKPRLYILGIVSYAFTFGDPQRHETRFAYNVTSREIGVAGPLQEIEVGKGLAQEEIALNDLMLGFVFHAD